MTLPATDLHNDLALPDETQNAIKAVKAITRILKKRRMTRTGGCKAFYTASEWLAKGNSYGKGASLIVVYDGGDLAHFFNPAYEKHKLILEMEKAIEAVGFYIQPCTHWSSALYPI